MLKILHLFSNIGNRYVEWKTKFLHYFYFNSLNYAQRTHSTFILHKKKKIYFILPPSRHNVDVMRFSTHLQWDDEKIHYDGFQTTIQNIRLANLKSISNEWESKRNLISCRTVCVPKKSNWISSAQTQQKCERQVRRGKWLLTMNEWMTVTRLEVSMLCKSLLLLNVSCSRFDTKIKVGSGRKEEDGEGSK